MTARIHKAAKRAQQKQLMEQVGEAIHRRRTKGWHLPAGAVCVTRPGVFGNPFTPEQCREAGYTGTDLEIKQRCVDAFRVWLGPHWRENWDGPESEATRAELIRRLPELRGKDLACWCPLDQPCHSDVLLELANQTDTPIAKG